MSFESQLEIEKGSTTPIVIILLNSKGDPEDLNQISSAQFVIKSSLSNDETIISVSMGSGISIVDGNIQVELTAEQAEALPLGLYPSQVKVTFSDSGKSATTNLFYTGITKGLI